MTTTMDMPCQSDNYFGQRDFLLGNCLFSVDQYFVLTDTPADKQATYVSTLLCTEALPWFRSNHENWNTSIPLTWLTLCASMKQNFAPPNEDRHLQDKWANLMQHGSVFEYVYILAVLAM
jgi:hypothetical protein